MSCCLVGAAAILFSACTESTYNREEVIGGRVAALKNNKESSLIEYIVVLNENVSIENAINILKKYEVQVIKDLKKGRYLMSIIEYHRVRLVDLFVDKHWIFDRRLVIQGQYTY